jgi:threonyl-tRNA synthetase
VAFARSIRDFYGRFGFSEVLVGLSTRPPERIGDDASWDRAERALADAAHEVGMAALEQPGEGAFYGPKLEFKLRDRLGRIWQRGTIQLDFTMPERFDLLYTDPDGQRRRPVMLHRALYGSLERFLGVLLEHHAGKLPAWLAAEPVHVLPVGQGELDYAWELVRALEAKQVCAVLADPAHRLAQRVASAREAGVPFVLVLGPREVAARQVSVSHAGAVQSFAFDAAVAHMREALHPEDERRAP